MLQVERARRLNAGEGISDQGIPDTSVLLYHIRVSIRFLGFHRSLHGPEDLSPHNSLLLCPRPKELLPFEELPFSLAVAPSIGARIDETGAWLYELEGHSSYVRDCAYSPDGRLIASASDHESIWLWDSDTGRVQHILEPTGSGHWFTRITFSPKDRGLLAAVDAQEIQLWNLSTGSPAKTLHAQSNDEDGNPVKAPIEDIIFSQDGNYLIAFMAGKLMAWELSSYQLIQGADLTERSMFNITHECARFSHDGNLLA